MKINQRINSNSSQTNFKAVNKRYFEWAEKEYKRRGTGTPACWTETFLEDVRWGYISKCDAIDTIIAIKKNIKKYNKDALDEIVQDIKEDFKRYIIRRKLPKEPGLSKKLNLLNENSK